MWVTAWILAASGALYQPTYPPFAAREDCEAVRVIYIRSRTDAVAACVQAKVFVYASR